MATQHERIASLEAIQKGHWLGLSLASLVAFTWLGWLTTTVNQATGDIRAIKQKIADGGLGSVATQINNPKSSAELAANLLVVASQARVAKVEGKKTEPASLLKLTTAVATSTEKNPSLPEEWQAAAALIAYRVPSNESISDEECGKNPEIMDFANSGTYGLSYQNCTIVLDDAKEILNSDMYVKLRNNNKQLPYLTLFLKNVRVIYRGGAILPVGAIAFTNCTFEFEMNVPPPLPAQHLAQALLTAADINKTTFTFPS